MLSCYDEENRLVEVQLNSVTIAEYTYDSLSGIMPHQAYARVQENPAGDGNRVESVVTDGSQTITTVYIGSYFEQITTSGVVTTTDLKKVQITSKECCGDW